jgi:hypothetical protein
MSGFKEICDHLACGLAVLNPIGNVLFSNRALQDLIGDGIVYKDAKFCAPTEDEQRTLDLLIRGMTTDASEYMKLSRPSGNAALLLRVVRLHSYGLRRSGSPRPLGVLVFVYIPTVSMPEIAAPLRELGLTAAEARLA